MDPDGVAIENLPDWGWCGVAAGAGGIAAATIGEPSREACLAVVAARLPVGGGDQKLARRGLEALRKALLGRDPEPLPPLDLEGTPFQKRIWSAALRIPRGQTSTYAEIAAAAGYPGRHYARAAGGALAANPAMVLMPCHRVTGSGGKLGGYGGGLPLKLRLLTAEGAAFSLEAPGRLRRRAQTG